MAPMKNAIVERECQGRDRDYQIAAKVLLFGRP
jgi:hypothetical protein